MKKLLIIIFILVVFFTIFYSSTSLDTHYSPNVNQKLEHSNTHSTESYSLLFQVLMAWWWYILYFLTGVVFGFFVYLDARNKEKLALNIGPIGWSVLVVLQPPLGILTYWLIHYSNLQRDENSSSK